MTKGFGDLHLRASDTASSVRAHVVDALAATDVAGLVLWYEPCAATVIRMSHAGGSDPDRVEHVRQVYNTAPAEALVSMGDHLRYPKPRTLREFIPGCELWGEHSNLQESQLYRTAFSAANIEDQLRLLVYDGSTFVAHVGLYRTPGEGTFGSHDKEHLAGLVAPITSLMCAAARMSWSSLPEETGDVLVCPNGSIALASESGRCWIRSSDRRASIARFVRTLGRRPQETGRASLAGAAVRWIRLHDGCEHRYLVQLERPERWIQPSAPLSPREYEVGELLARGASVADAARLLDVSTETIRTHARAVYRKLGVSNRAVLAARWDSAKRKPPPNGGWSRRPP